jgi:hypothetical protein
MPVTKVIRYRTKPEHADENERLIRAVFAAFQAGIAERCAEGPVPADATQLGSFRLKA